jgi:hypothetical protein
VFVHTPARGDSHMGLGANSCGIVASQLGAAPGARDSATWLQNMREGFIVAGDSRGSRYNALLGLSLNPHVRGSLGSREAYIHVSPCKVKIGTIMERQCALRFPPLYRGVGHTKRQP